MTTYTDAEAARLRAIAALRAAGLAAEADRLAALPRRLTDDRQAEAGIQPRPRPARGSDVTRWGDWMQTNSGGRFYLLDPRVEDVCPEDIAHALSLLCRYGGHVDRFYSVAEHCVLLSRAVAPEHALAALLHDATEAYVVDVPRPLKRYLPTYREIEDMVWRVIAARFGIPEEMPEAVKEADSRILLTERATLMRHAERWSQDDDYVPLPVEVAGWLPDVAEQTYLRRLAELTA